MQRNAEGNGQSECVVELDNATEDETSKLVMMIDTQRDIQSRRIYM